MKNTQTRFMRRKAFYKGHRIDLTGVVDGMFCVDCTYPEYNPSEPMDWLVDYKVEDQSWCTGKIRINDPGISVDGTGRLYAEEFARYKSHGWLHGQYKGRRVLISKIIHSHHGEFYFAEYRLNDGNTESKDIGWLQNVIKMNDMCFCGQIPISEAGEIRFEEEVVDKMAFYRGFHAVVSVRRNDMHVINLLLPESLQCKQTDWFFLNFKIEAFEGLYCTIPVSDQDLYIDDTEIIREDLLTHTFPVNWRAAEYKGCKIMVGAHSATHHFVTHHADILLPRGVIPAFLSSVTATQTGPQDFMAKIPIGDPDLIFIDPQKHPDN